MERGNLLISIFLISVFVYSSAKTLPAGSDEDSTTIGNTERPTTGDPAASAVAAGNATGTWVTNAADGTKTWVEGAAADTKEWTKGAAADTKVWVEGAAKDTKDWTEGAAEKTKSFVSDIFG